MKPEVPSYNEITWKSLREVFARDETLSILLDIHSQHLATGISRCLSYLEVSKKVINACACRDSWFHRKRHTENELDAAIQATKRYKSALSKLNFDAHLLDAARLNDRYFFAKKKAVKALEEIGEPPDEYDFYNRIESYSVSGMLDQIISGLQHQKSVPKRIRTRRENQEAANLLGSLGFVFIQLGFYPPEYREWVLYFYKHLCPQNYANKDNDRSSFIRKHSGATTPN